MSCSDQRAGRKAIMPPQTTITLPKLAAPAQRALAAANIQRLDQLTHFTEAEIKQLHGIGPNALETLRRALAEHGLAFADKP